MIVKLHVASLSLKSSAVIDTVVFPAGKTLPDEEVEVKVKTPELSVTCASDHVTMALNCPESVGCVMSAGQEMFGDSISKNQNTNKHYLSIVASVAEISNTYLFLLTVIV